MMGFKGQQNEIVFEILFVTGINILLGLEAFYF